MEQVVTPPSNAPEIPGLAEEAAKLFGPGDLIPPRPANPYENVGEIRDFIE